MFTFVTSGIDRQTPAELLKDATFALQEENYEDAIYLMYMYLNEVEETKAERVIAIAQDLRYRLATTLVHLNRLDEAIVILEDYISNPEPNHSLHAYKMMATCYFELNQYDECIKTVSNALSHRILSSTLLLENNLESSTDGGSHKVAYTQNDRIALNLLLAESHFYLKNWSESLPPFEYVIEHTIDDQQRGYAIMQLINALIETKDFNRITRWISELYQTDARYDIRVNLALLNTAAALYDEGEYDSALPLYRMIVPRYQLLSYHQDKLQELRLDAGLPPLSDAEMASDEKVLFGSERTEINNEVFMDQITTVVLGQNQVQSITNRVKINNTQKLFEQEDLLRALTQMDPYELDVEYRMADLYKTVDRFWESVAFFDRVYNQSPNTDIGARAIYEMVELLLFRLDRPLDAENLIFTHTERFSEGITPRQLLYMLNDYYQGDNNMQGIKRIEPFLNRLTITDDQSIMQYDAELYFMQAIADLVLLEYKKAEEGFKKVLDRFGDSHQASNSLYWYAMAKLFLQNYEEALLSFENYLSLYPDEVYSDESEFQIGVCLFGLESYEEAIDRFSKVINYYPNSTIFSEACSMRADLYGSKGLLDEAIEDYKNAFSSAKNINQASYPCFQMAEVYEAEERFDKIIQCIEEYLNIWEEEADIAKAIFWIGKTKIQQKKIDEAISAYIDAIVLYGKDIKQNGVDLMIAELIKISKVFLDSQQKDQLRKKILQANELNKDMVLDLRLRSMLADIEGNQVDLGLTLIKELGSLANASPPVLACICEASLVHKDYSRSEELLNMFKLKFDNSDYMKKAYKLRVFDQIENQEYQSALITINEAQDNYGSVYDLAWAQLIKSDLLLKLARYDEAYQANLAIMSVPAWRGEPVAQATYQLGQIKESQGDFLQAFGFYQRTYFQFKAYNNGYWAAEAYLASARCLSKLGLYNDERNTYRAMLYDNYVNKLPQSDVARDFLGSAEVLEIEYHIETGIITNISVNIEISKDEVWQ